MTSQTPNRKTPYILFCWLNIGLGGVSLLMGLAMLLKPGLIFGTFAGPNAAFMLWVGAIFLLFGVLRIVNGALHIRRIKRIPGERKV